MNIGIVGAGTMGAGIALTCLYADLPVKLYDLYPAALERAQAYIEQYLTKKDLSSAIRKLTLTSYLPDLGDCQYIIEAASEDETIKHTLFQHLDDICTGETILATNTSTLAVTQIAAVTARPERVVGMHFFNPAPLMKLVEVVQGVQTSTETIQKTVDFARQLGKSAVIVQDSPGFLVNRVARPFYLESLRIVTEGIATPQQVDSVMQLMGGFRMGPFQLMDVIGIDVNLAASRSVYQMTFQEPRFRPSLLQAKMVQANRLGRKTGRGFYIYHEGAIPFELPDVPQMQMQSGSIYAAVQSPLSTYCATAGYTLANHPHGAVAAFIDQETDITPLSDTLLLVDLSANSSLMANAIGYDGALLRHSRAVTLVAGTGVSSERRDQAEALMCGVGLAVLWLDRPTPGLIFARVLAQIINEAAFAVGEGVAEPARVDLALKLGMNYPNGPFEWGEALGYRRVFAILDSLFEYYREERYRPAPLLRQWMAQAL